MRYAVLLAVVAATLVACGSSTDEASLELATAAMSLVTDVDAMTTEDLDGNTVTGIIHILVEVNNRNVSEVRLHLNGDATPLEVDTDMPFELHLDTTALADGAHLIVAVAPVGRGGTTRELARAEFDVANGDAPGGPDASVPNQDLGPGPVFDPKPIDGVRVEVGVDPRVVVGAHPAGTTFVFASGVHRLLGPIVPRDGDSFVGEFGAVLNGSRLLTSFEREGGLWVVSGQTQQGVRTGECEEDAPRCSFPEMLFMDDVPLRHVASLSEVVAGAWFFDYEGDRIFFADDPTGRVVETSIARAAISSDADDVTVRGLVVEKFANPARPGGAIDTRVSGDGGSTQGERWVIENNTVRLNHSVGITAGYGAQIRNNRVLWNGQMGLGGGGGYGTLVEGNEIAYNNWAGFLWGWEGGGAKWVNSDGLIVRNNHSHHNNGPGLWTDIDNINTLYEHNLVEHNTDVGIFHEISYKATIRHNTVLHNGIGQGYEQYMYVFGSGILVSSSSDVTIYGNVVRGNWNGITALQGDRGVGRYGDRHVRNLHVYANDVEMTYWEDGYNASGSPTGVAGMTGVFRNGGPDDIWDVESGNRFEGNRYTLVSGASRTWSWENVGRDFAAWQAFGQDATGTMQDIASSTMAVR